MPQIFNDATTLYSNFFHTALWLGMSSASKKLFLADEENIAPIEKRRYRTPEATQERAEITKPGEDNKPENVAKAMRLVNKNALVEHAIIFHDGLFDEAKKIAKEMLNSYFADVLKPPVSTSELYGILEKYPRPGNTVTHLTRFDKGTREARKETSAAMRSAFNDYVIWQADGLAPYMRSGQKYARAYQVFFRPVNENATQAQKDEINKQNYELSILFNSTNDSYSMDEVRIGDDKYNTWKKNREKEMEWVRDTLISKYTDKIVDGVKQRQPKTEEEIDREVKDYFRPENMRKRRGEIVMQQVRESTEVLNNLDTLMAPGQSPEKIKENYFKVAIAQSIYQEMNAYVAAAEPDTGYLELSHKDRKWLGEQDDYALNLAVAVSTLNMTANPLYEYVEPQELIHFDMLKTTTYYEGLFGDQLDIPEEDRRDPIFKKGNRTEKQNQAMEELDPYYKANKGPARDSLACLSFDANMLQFNKLEVVKYASERMFEDYGFVRGATRRFCETYGNGKPDNYDFRQPVAYALGNRVVILSSSDSVKDSFITKDSPEKLFNHKIENTAEFVGKAFGKANRWYTGNNNGYETIGLRFEQALKEGKLPSGCKAKDLERFKKSYKALENAATYYLAKKGDNVKRGLESQRVEAAKKMQKFAKMKLNELDLVGKAIQTLDKYKGKSREEIRAETAKENASPQYAAYIKAEVPKAQAEAPVKWLNSQYTTFYAGGLTSHVREKASVSSVASSMLGQLERAENPYAPEMKDTIVEMAGSLIALEAIRQERGRLNSPGKRGPVENMIENDYDEMEAQVKDFGKQAIETLTGKEVDQLDSQDLEKFLKEFNQRNYVQQVNEKCGISLLEQKLTGQYVNSVTPERSEKLDAHEQKLQEFAKTNILDPAKKYMEKPNDVHIDPADARKLMSSCVLHSMIQMERAGNHGKKPGLLESKLMNTEGVEELRRSIEISEPFQDMMKKVTHNGDLYGRDIVNLLEQNAPQEAAKKSLEKAAEEPVKRPRAYSFSFDRKAEKNNEANLRADAAVLDNNEGEHEEIAENAGSRSRTNSVSLDKNAEKNKKAMGNADARPRANSVSVERKTVKKNEPKPPVLHN